MIGRRVRSGPMWSTRSRQSLLSDRFLNRKWVPKSSVVYYDSHFVESGSKAGRKSAHLSGPQVQLGSDRTWKLCIWAWIGLDLLDSFVRRRSNPNPKLRNRVLLVTRCVCELKFRNDRSSCPKWSKVVHQEPPELPL